MRSFRPNKPGYVRRIEFCYTPKHGSWLNIAENELSSMTRQCRHHHQIGELETLGRIQRLRWLVTEAHRLEWQMKIEDAHCN